MDNNRPSAEEHARQLADPKRTEVSDSRAPYRSMDYSLMRTAVIAGLVFMLLGAAVALWVFLAYSK